MESWSAKDGSGRFSGCQLEALKVESDRASRPLTGRIFDELSQGEPGSDGRGVGRYGGWTFGSRGSFRLSLRLHSGPRPGIACHVDLDDRIDHASSSDKCVPVAGHLAETRPDVARSRTTEDGVAEVKVPE